MRDVKITTIDRKNNNDTETKIISEIELANILDKGDIIPDVEKALAVVNDIIDTMRDSIDAGYEKADSGDTIMVDPIFGLFNVSTFVDPLHANTISNFTDCCTDMSEFFDNTVKHYTSEKFHFLLRIFTEIRTKILKGVKIYEVTVYNANNNEHYKLSEFCSGFPVYKSGLVDNIYTPKTIQIIDNPYRITLTPVTGDKRKNLINSSIYRRRVDVISLTETVSKCIQAICY